MLIIRSAPLTELTKLVVQCNSMLKQTILLLSDTVAVPGEGPGDPALPPNFSTKIRPEWRKKIFWRPGPPLLISGSG